MLLLAILAATEAGSVDTVEETSEDSGEALVDVLDGNATSTIGRDGDVGLAGGVGTDPLGASTGVGIDPSVLVASTGEGIDPSALGVSTGVGIDPSALVASAGVGSNPRSVASTGVGGVTTAAAADDESV